MRTIGTVRTALERGPCENTHTPQSLIHPCRKQRRIPLNHRLALFKGFIKARLSPESYLGLHLTLGVLTLIGAAWLFGSIAEDVVTKDEITILDVQIANWFNAHAVPQLTTVMLAVTHMHGVAGISIATFLFALYLARKKSWYWLLALAITVPGGMLLNTAMKFAFHRARPSFDNPLLTLATYSFPSGHAAGTTLFYGILAAYLVARIRSWHARSAIAVCAALLVAAVAFSRVYLGVHYLSDVLAGCAEAIAWLAICLTAVGGMRHRRIARYGLR